MTDPAPVRYAVEDAVATITLDRATARNAFTREVLTGFRDAALRAADDRAVRAIVVTGANGHFCAGADVKMFGASVAEGGQDGVARLILELTHDFHGAVSTLARARKPWISVVDGTAAGGGFSLAIAADLTIASDAAKFTFAYPGIGLAPDGSSTWSLVRLMGLKQALRLAYLNPTLTAEEALRLGLVSEVVPQASLEARGREVARSLAAGPTLAYAAAKRLLRASTEGASLEAQMEDEREAITGCARSADFVEGAMAFAEKRKARFVGS